MVFARSSIRAGIWKWFPRQLLFTQTPGDCGRDAQPAHSLFKFLKNPLLTRAPFGHQGPEPTGIWGQWDCWGGPCQRAWASVSSSLSGLQVAGWVPAGTAVAVARARARLVMLQPEPSPVGTWARAPPALVVAPAPTLTCHHLLLQQPSTHISFSLYQARIWALSPPVWCNPQWSPWCRDDLLTPTGQHKRFLFLCSPHPTKCSGSELARWGDRDEGTGWVRMLWGPQMFWFKLKGKGKILLTYTRILWEAGYFPCCLKLQVTLVESLLLCPVITFCLWTNTPKLLLWCSSAAAQVSLSNCCVLKDSSLHCLLISVCTACGVFLTSSGGQWIAFLHLGDFSE